MGCWDPCTLRPQRTGKGWGVTPVGRLFFAALLGSGCQHGAAAEPSHWPCVGREVSLTGAEVALAAIFRVRVLSASASCTPCCCSCPSLVLQGRSRAQPLPWSQARSCSPVAQISWKSQEEVGKVPAGRGEPAWDIHGPKVSRCPKKGLYCLYSQGQYPRRVWALLVQEVLVPLSGGNRGDRQSLVPSKGLMHLKIELIL